MKKNISLNSKKEQFIVCLLIEQSCKLQTEYLYFPLLLNNICCSKEFYNDRIQYQLTVYIHANGIITLDNVNKKEAGCCYLENIGYIHSKIKRNIKNSIEMQIFPLYLEDEFDNVSHANIMIIAYDKYIKKKTVFVFDPFGKGAKQYSWWSDKNSVKLKKELSRVVDIFHFADDDENKTECTWYLPNNSFMGGIQPQLHENKLKDKSTKITGFCSTWSFIFIHYIGLKIDEYFKWNNKVVGVNTLIKIIKSFEKLIKNNNSSNLAVVVKYYSEEIRKIVQKSESYCIKGYTINKSLLNSFMDIMHNCVTLLYKYSF